MKTKKSSYITQTLTISPLFILTIVPFLVLGAALGAELSAKYILLGALGWWVALLLRFPVILLVKRLKLSQMVVVVASGPAEEIVRLALLVMIGLTPRRAFCLGLGWASIEIIYSIAQGAAMASLRQRTDAKAMQAKALLKEQGMDRVLDANTPLWGVLERLSANAVHIGFSLLLVVSPYLVILTAPLHSLLNVGMTKMIKDSIARAELVFALAASVILLAAIILV